jgi:serine/threonine-protein kinase
VSTGPPAKPVRLRNARPIPPRIGQYAIQKKIGQGGAGVVYLGDDESLGRTVAIKVLHKAVARDKQNVERFKREARVMARISSPYVASVFAVGEHEGLPFMVMEFLRGENLEQVMKKIRQIPVVEALGYVRDSALGLEAASSAGVIHRDIKPANIVVEGGRAKITDFGVARPMDGSGQVTMHGQIAGTAAFMSPERVRGEQEDLRSDIYSLGATLYTLMAGQPPFVKASPLEVLTAHLDEEPPPLSKFVDVDLEVEMLVKRMMDKNRDARFQTYQELIADIHQVLEGLEGGAELTGRFIPPPSSQLAAPPTSSGAGGDAFAQQMSGVMGTLKQMSVMEIVQLLDIGKKTAMVDLTPTGGATGSLGFEGGKLRYAAHDQLDGEEAFYFLATVKEGAFQIKYGAKPPRTNVHADGTFLMIEALRRQDEGNRPSEPTSPNEAAPRTDVTEPDAAPARAAPIVTAPEDENPFAVKTQWAAPPIDDSLPPPDLDGGPSGPIIKVPTDPRQKAAAVAPVGGFDSVVNTDVVDRSGAGPPPPPDFNESTLLPPNARIQQAGGAFLDKLSSQIEAELSFIRARFTKTDPNKPRVSGTFAAPRAPWLIIGAASTLLLIFVLILVAALSGGEFSLDDARERIANGEAAVVLTQIESIPIVDREPGMELARGHALAALGQGDLAVGAYRAAVKGGVVDDAALAFVVGRLSQPAPEAAVDMLIEWPDVAWKDHMVELVEGDNWNLRQRAFTVLSERGATDLVDLEKMAIRDLKEGPSCDARRRALKLIADIGKSEASRKAVLEARAEGAENACMKADFKKMLGR